MVIELQMCMIEKVTIVYGKQQSGSGIIATPCWIVALYSLGRPLLPPNPILGSVQVYTAASVSVIAKVNMASLLSGRYYCHTH